MPTLVFPDSDTLRLVLASGGVAAPVMGAPADVGWDDQGRLWLTTNAALTRESAAALRRFGVRVDNPGKSPHSEHIACWQQLLPLEKMPSSAPIPAGAVLFEVPGRELSSIVSEIERGAKPWSMRWLDDIANDDGSDRCLVKTESPPFFTLLRSFDDNSTLAFAEQAPRVWTAVGWRHPLADQIHVPAGKMLFLRPARHWQWRDEAAFQQRVAHENVQPVSTSIATGRLLTIPMPLRLVPLDDSAPAEMWLIRRDAFRWLEPFLQGIDERMLQRFTCAVASSNGEPALVLRVRGKGPAPILLEAPLGFRPLLKLANLYLPCGYGLAPVLRRDTIRQLLAANPERLTWLRPLEDGGFATESIASDAFRPLTEFVEHRLEMPTRRLAAWNQTAWLNFERFSVQSLEPSLPVALPESLPALKKPQPEPREDKPRTGSWLSRTLRLFFRTQSKREIPALPATEDIMAPIPVDDAVRTALPMSAPRTIEHSLRIDEARQSARTLAARFHESLEDFTPSLRLELWPKLGAAFAHANQHSDAALCWLNALWEVERPTTLWAWGWLRAEAIQAGWNPDRVDLGRWLAAPADKHRPRAVAAYALWATLQEVPPARFADSLTGLNGYLEANEQHLPIRAIWLVRTALARSTRGDVLGLAHARDRILDRLRDRGLSLASDVPSFVRNVGAEDPDRLNQVAKWLTAKRRTINEWIASLASESRPHSDTQPPLLPYLDAEIPCTQAYADLMIAWGLSRLGENNEADRLRELAAHALPDSDPIHGALRAIFDHRLHEARENQTAAALPLACRARLDGLGRNERYQVDWLLHRSRILEPLERIDPRWASTMRHYRGWNELQKQLIELPGLERNELNRKVRNLLDRFEREEPSARREILIAVLGLAGRVDRASVEVALDRALGIPISSPENLRRIVDSGLLAAAALGLDGKVRLFAHRFGSFVEEQKGQGSHELFAGLTGQTFRALRKFGMKEEADNVLSKIAQWLTRGKDLHVLRRERVSEWPVLLRTLLHVSAGWYFCGRSTQGHRIIEEARTKDLFDNAVRSFDHRVLSDRAALAVVYASTIGQIPAKLALGYFDELFLRLKHIAVSGWNTHYTLQPLELIDTVIRAVVSDDFSLGPAVRGWLDDDEFNVRQRIHREMSEWMERQGV
jgi:hypothetical protein